MWHLNFEQDVDMEKILHKISVYHLHIIPEKNDNFSSNKPQPKEFGLLKFSAKPDICPPPPSIKSFETDRSRNR